MMIQSVGGEFLQIAKRPAVLIIPGGGYSMCSDREAEVVAYPYLYAGYQTFALRYSVGDHRTWPNPLEDYEQAMELIRSKADEWNVMTDRIAVIGFSAWGHLAAVAATMAKNRPNAAILGYAALEQDIASACQPGVNIPAPVDHVDGKTCPCFLMACCDDPIVPIRITLNFQSRLAENGIRFESHIYPYGGHGFGTGAPNIVGTGVCRRVPNWVADSIGWLEDIFGILTPSGMTAPVCGGKINGDGEMFLSVNCTLNRLWTNMSSRAQLSEVFAVVDKYIQENYGGHDLVRDVIFQMRLRELLITLGYTGEKITALDERLTRIPNNAI